MYRYWWVVYVQYICRYTICPHTPRTYLHFSLHDATSTCRTLIHSSSRHQSLQSLPQVPQAQVIFSHTNLTTSLLRNSYHDVQIMCKYNLSLGACVITSHQSLVLAFQSLIVIWHFTIFLVSWLGASHGASRPIRAFTPWYILFINLVSNKVEKENTT